MEDVLEVYQLPHDPNIPLVCMDEQSLQLVKETHLPIPAKPGTPAREDHEYERNGTANIFMFAAPLENWRRVDVTESRTAKDWAEQIHKLFYEDFPEATRIRLVMDNLNTHDIASLYKAFPPQEARRLAEKLEIHHTPKHGSWLNIAEIELSAMTKQCLGRRIPDLWSLSNETVAWELQRNESQTGVNWRFTTENARIKLKHLYPEIKT
jgi:hypothetical protein